MHVPRTVPVVGVLLGFAALLRGLMELDIEPFVAVLGLLAAMALLLASAAVLFADEAAESIRRTEDHTRFEP